MPSLFDSLAQSAGDTLHISVPPLLSPDSVPAFGGYVVPPMVDYQAVARMFGDSVPPARDRAAIWREAATLMQPDGVVGKPVAWNVRYDDTAVGTLLWASSSSSGQPSVRVTSSATGWVTSSATVSAPTSSPSPRRRCYAVASL